MRVSVVVACIAFMLSPTAASPWYGSGLARPSGAIPVVDRSASSSSEDSDGDRNLRPDDCRRYGKNYIFHYCRFYKPIAIERRRARGGAPEVKPKRDQATGPQSQTFGREHASRALAGRDFHDNGARPLLAALGAPIGDPKSKVAGQHGERLRMMAGQLFLASFSGKQPADPDAVRVAEALRTGTIAGIMIDPSNIASFSQLRPLLAAIAKASGDAAPLIAIDQPGGPDSALSEDRGFTFFESASAVSSDRSPYDAERLYRDMAAELAALGVTLNIGPSADICREEGVELSASCFGTAPERVAAFAAAFSTGHHERGVLTALRHVPYRTGVQTPGIPEHANTALLREVIKRRSQSDALVVRVKAMDLPSIPEAAFGLTHSNAYSGLGFGGALIFELDMGLAGTPIRYDEAIVRAFRAGADMVLLSDTSSLTVDISVLGYESMRDGLASGRLRMSRVEDAYRHVQRLKDRLRRLQPKTQIAGNAQ